MEAITPKGRESNLGIFATNQHYSSLEKVMKKSLFYRLFGWGKIPKKYLPILEDEGIVLHEDGISGSITFKSFRAPGRYHSWKRNWFVGSIVITDKTFAAFSLMKPLIYVLLDQKEMLELHCTLEKENTLLITYDASAFNDKWSGTIECRFKTDKAMLFLEKLPGSVA